MRLLMWCIRGSRIPCGGDRGTRNGDDGVVESGDGWVVESVVG